jgi:hypothetical protein
MTKELERMQTRSSPDNKRKRSEVGLGTQGRSEGEDHQVRGLSSDVGSGDLGNESDNESEIAYCLADPLAPTSEEWQIVHPKHTRKQRSVDVHTAEKIQLNRSGAAQSGYGPPSEASFLAAYGVLPSVPQAAGVLPVYSANGGRRQWDPGKRWDPGIPKITNGYMVHEVPRTRRLVYESLASPQEDAASDGSTEEETIQLCIWARPHHKFGYPTGAHVWSRAVAIVPTLPQRSRQPRETTLEVEPVEDSRALMKNAKALETTKMDQGQQVYTEHRTCRQLAGNVGTGVGHGIGNTGVMYTGQNGTVSDGYSRLAVHRVPQPLGL